MTRHHRISSKILALQQRFDAGRSSSAAALRECLERIAEYDKLGPCVNAVSEINPDAREAADALDRERRNRGPRGPLHGVPILVKDNINTRDRLNTTAGSHYLLGVRSGRDAHIVARLRRAGAVVVGKTNMDELASGNGTPSGRGGQIRNPYCLSRNASGSSGGSAAGVAAGFCTAALGTDTLSSLRFPAADCSLVGVRPTFGLLSSSGIFPGSVTIDAPGPLALSVTDATILLHALMKPGAALRELHAWLTDRRRPPGALPSFGLRGVRVGVMTDGLLGYHAGLDRVIERALTALNRAGAVLTAIDPIEIVDYGGACETDRRIIQAVDNVAMLHYFEHLPPSAPERSFDLFRALACLSTVPSSLPKLKRSLHAPADLLRRFAVPPERYHAARRRFFDSQRAQVFKAMRARRFDVLVFPTKSVPATSIVHADREREPTYRQECLASFGGLPEVTVPAGYTDDEHLPVGLSFVGRPRSEARLLECAYAFERAIHCWRKARLPRRRPAQACALPERPPNDLFDHASPLTGLEGCVRGNSLLARIERHEPRHGTKHDTDRSVWFQWQAPDDVRVSFWLEQQRSAFHVLAIYAGGALDEVKELASTNVEQASGFCVSFDARRLREYRIAVATSEPLVGSGEFHLRWGVRP